MKNETVLDNNKTELEDFIIDLHLILNKNIVKNLNKKRNQKP